MQPMCLPLRGPQPHPRHSLLTLAACQGGVGDPFEGAWAVWPQPGATGGPQRSAAQSKGAPLTSASITASHRAAPVISSSWSAFRGVFPPSPTLCAITTITLLQLLLNHAKLLEQQEQQRHPLGPHYSPHQHLQQSPQLSHPLASPQHPSTPSSQASPISMPHSSEAGSHGPHGHYPRMPHGAVAPPQYTGSGWGLAAGEGAAAGTPGARPQMQPGSAGSQGTGGSQQQQRAQAQGLASVVGGELTPQQRSEHWLETQRRLQVAEEAARRGSLSGVDSAVTAGSSNASATGSTAPSACLYTALEMAALPASSSSRGGGAGAGPSLGRVSMAQQLPSPYASPLGVGATGGGSNSGSSGLSRQRSRISRSLTFTAKR